MPRINIDYSKSIIYKLVHKDDYDNVNVYIGSTTDFKSRKNTHKSDCHNPNHKNYNIKVYQYIRQTGGFDEWIMVWLEDHPCEGKPQACARERYWCEYYKSKLNSQVPGRTNKEWYKDNKEHNKEISADWYQRNKEEYNIKCKIYREKNKEHVKEIGVVYYQKHKEEYKIKREKKDKIECDKCGSVVVSKLGRHKKTQKCINFVPILNIQNP